METVTFYEEKNNFPNNLVFANQILELQNKEFLRPKVKFDKDKKHYFNLYNFAPIAYCVLSKEGQIKEANLTASDLLGLTQENLLKEPFSRFIQKNHEDTYKLFRKNLLQSHKYTECELELIASDKKVFWAHLSAVVCRNGIRLLFKNISKRKKVEEKREIAANIFTHTSEAIMITESDGTIYDVNEAFENITGYTREEVIGKNPKILSSGYHKKDFYRLLWHTLLDKGSWSGEIWNARKNGEVYAEKLIINKINNIKGAKQYYIALFSDITKSKEQMKELEHIAYYDVLTGLPNRILLSDRLKQNMKQVQRRKHLLALAFIDIDGFKGINDSYGHDVGDKSLIALAKQMQSALREEDTLARIGGDEFIAVLSDLADMKSALPLISRLLDAASKEFSINETFIQVSASIGVTFYPQSKSIDPENLLNQADQAMYEAKMSGKNRYYIFNTN